MSDDALVVVSVAHGVGRLRLNRPEKRNAIDSAVAREILAAMRRLDADDSVVVIVVEGTEGSFCAGADMGEALAAYEAADFRFNPSEDAALRVGASPKPTIAAIDGPAYGAGAQLACGCDLRICSDRARFRFPGAEYGLVVGAARLERLVGNALAKELIFTSRVVGADEAARIGLANRVVPSDQLAATVDELAASIAASSPEALRWAKAAIDAASAGGDAEAIERQSDLVLRGGTDNMDRFGRATRRITGGSSGSNA
jgi:enoyl-CoA hydratase/carnithine racemase